MTAYHVGKRAQHGGKNGKGVFGIQQATIHVRCVSRKKYLFLEENPIPSLQSAVKTSRLLYQPEPFGPAADPFLERSSLAVSNGVTISGEGKASRVN